MSPERNYLIEVDHPVLVVGAGGQSFQVDLNPDAPDYVTPDGTEVWIERKAQKTRFLDADGNQVGPVHKNLVPAILCAIAQGWRDPTSPDWWNDELYEEVARGGAPLDKHHTTANAVGPYEQANA